MNTKRNQENNIRQAYEVLGLAENAHAEEIRHRYRLLMHSFHPDTTGNEEHARALAERARQINDAYQTLKRNGPVLIRQGNHADPHIRRNEAAFCSRRLYMEEALYGESMYIDTGLYGRYTWDPEMESFPMLLKSVHEAARRVLEEQNELFHAQEHRQKLQTKLLHLLLQEFVEPERCLETLPFCRKTAEGAALKTDDNGSIRCWRIRCHLRTERRCLWKENGFNMKKLQIKARENKLFAIDQSGETVGQITFRENELYYVVTPLILQGAASAVLELPAGDREKISGELLLKVFTGKWKDPTPAINREIAAMLHRN